MSEETKNLLQSKTVWGALVAVIGAIMSAFGFDTGILQGIDGEVVTLIGGILAIYGRVAAVKKIK